MRGMKLFGVAFVVAAGAFWATVFTTPPKSEARPPAGINTGLLTLDAKPALGEQYDAF